MKHLYAGSLIVLSFGISSAATAQAIPGHNACGDLNMVELNDKLGLAGACAPQQCEPFQANADDIRIFYRYEAPYCYVKAIAFGPTAGGGYGGYNTCTPEISYIPSHEHTEAGCERTDEASGYQYSNQVIELLRNLIASRQCDIACD